MSEKRDVGLDVAKALAMLTIVFIHVRTNAPDGEYGFVAGVDNFITTVVMALFVMVSGILSKGLMTSGNVPKLLLRLVTYVWPVFTMMLGLGSAVGYLVYGRWQVPGGSLVHYLLNAGWFFFCMALCDALTFAAHAFARNGRKRLAVLLGAAFAALWVLPFGLCHVKDMILYFWFGLYAYPMLVRSPWCRALGLASFAFCLSVCVVLPDFRPLGLFVHDMPMPAGTFTWKGCGIVAFKQLLGLTGAFGTVEVIRLLPPFLRGMRLLGNLGTQTLGVFFIHLPLITVYYGWVGWRGCGVVGRFALACVFFLISHCLVVLTKMNPTVGAILWNPIQLFKRKDVAK